MGFPKPWVISIVSHKDAEVSSVVAAILGKGQGSPSPKYIPSCVYPRNLGWELIKAGQESGFHIRESIAIWFLDPRQISFWMVLESEAEIGVRRNIERGGPRHKDYYESFFPDPVVLSEIELPSRWKYDTLSYLPWFEDLEESFKPWKERIWNTFCNSS